MGFTLESGGYVALDNPELSAGDDILNERELLAGDAAQNTDNHFLPMLLGMPREMEAPSMLLKSRLLPLKSHGSDGATILEILDD